MKTILLPTDFSKDAEKGYATAASIAKAMGVGIHIFHLIKSHVQELNFGYSGLNAADQVSKLDGGDMDDTETKLKALSESEIFEGVKITSSYSLVFEGDVVEGIIEEINRQDYGLIVMGTAGEDQKEEALAEIVARHTVTPIITCKESLPAFAPKNILVCTDFQNITRGFLKRLDSIGSKYGAKYTFLYVNTHKHFKSTKEIKSDYNRVKRNFEFPNIDLIVHNDYSIKEAVLDVSSQGGFDLIAMATQGKRGISRLFLGSNTEEILTTSSVPVYSYNLHEYQQRHNPEATASFRSGFTG